MRIKDENKFGKYVMDVRLIAPGKGFSYTVRKPKDNGTYQELGMFQEMGPALNYITELLTLESAEEMTLSDYQSTRERIFTAINDVFEKKTEVVQ